MVPIASSFLTRGSRRTMLLSAALACCGLAVPLASAQAADAYPSKPVTLLVPYPAGAPTTPSRAWWGRSWAMPCGNP